MIYKYVRTGHGSTLKNAMEFESAWVGKDSAEYIAEDAAEDYFENHDGWESSWPQSFQIWTEDDEDYGVFEVEMEHEPVFSASET